MLSSQIASSFRATTLAASILLAGWPLLPATAGGVPKGISASDWARIRAAHQAPPVKVSASAPSATDSIAQQAYLKASNTDANDFFGVAVAMSGNTVVVGANGEASRATEVNGDQTDNSMPNAGAVYVFVREGLTWKQQAYLKPSATTTNLSFGTAVAISGDTVVVGSTQAGTAYVFVRDGETWTEQAHLISSNNNTGDTFGLAVAVSGDTIVVSAPNESSSATGVNGDQFNNDASQAGAAYVFVRNGATWTQQAYLKASNTDAGDTFGTSVAVFEDTIVVGAEYEAGQGKGVNPDDTDNSAARAGAAYVFVRAGTIWEQQAYLKASNTDAGDRFGISVALFGETAVVASGIESSKATGVNGDQTDNSLFGAGAAYVFVRSGGTWTQQAYLKASNSDESDFFGASISLFADSLVVGAFPESSNATGVNGDQSDNSTFGAGAAYVFLRTGTDWKQQAYLKASNPAYFDFFGYSVAIAGDTVVAGAQFESSDATGVDGDQGNDSAIHAGAVYVFTGLGAPVLGNISTRLFVETGDNALIGGFIVTGTQPKKVLLRAIGPSLPLAGTLSNPTLQLFGPAGLIASNDDWVNSGKKQEIIDSTLAPANDLESAIVATLPANSTGYTAILRGTDNSTGIALVEAYDLDRTVDSKLANISTRGLVQTGDNALIGGFIVLGTEAQTVIVRAIGPSLPVPGSLADPTLELHDSNGALLTANDNWRDTQESEIAASGLQPASDAESAILQTLPPAAYTAIVRGAGDTTGIALVEVYGLAP